MKTYKQEYNLIFEKGNTLIISCFFMIGILFLDNMNFILKTYEENNSLSVAILILFFIIILVKLVELKNIIKVRIINDIDFLIAISLISASILLIIYIWILKDINYKIEVLSFIMVISIIGLVIRIYMINNALMKVNEKTNIYTLKDLYENKISLSDSHTIFLNEEEESYDLLERNNIIEKLYEAIVNCNPKRKFVISLEGNWGSGKTTILNIVSKKINDNNKDIKIISSFDPWSYNDQISMFRSMFDILLKETGISYSIGKTKRLVNDIYNILFSTKYTKGIKDLNFFNHDKTTEIEKMKKMINNYLHISNKRIVFIIDNLDRAEKENIILLFKLVNNVFNFEYVTYILSFDDNKLKKILENQLDIDYEFISKIVQLPIKIPPLDLEVKNEVISTCFKNIIRLYGEDNLEKYNDLINSLSKLIIDMRDFKRFINSVVSVHYKNCEMLNPIDLISIELINFYNKDLYISIKENPKYYISSDLIYFNEYFLASIQRKKI
nr:MAG TPA: KAP family P-loop domain [Caudoviricetes sp.]